MHDRDLKIFDFQSNVHARFELVTYPQVRRLCIWCIWYKLSSWRHQWYIIRYTCAIYIKSDSVDSFAACTHRKLFLAEILRSQRKKLLSFYWIESIQNTIEVRIKIEIWNSHFELEVLVFTTFTWNDELEHRYYPNQFSDLIATKLKKKKSGLNLWCFDCKCDKHLFEIEKKAQQNIDWKPIFLFDIRLIDTCISRVNTMALLRGIYKTATVKWQAKGYGTESQQPNKITSESECDAFEQILHDTYVRIVKRKTVWALVLLLHLSIRLSLSRERPIT